MNDGMVDDDGEPIEEHNGAGQNGEGAAEMAGSTPIKNVHVKNVIRKTIIIGVWFFALTLPAQRLYMHCILLIMESKSEVEIEKSRAKAANFASTSTKINIFPKLSCY